MNDATLKAICDAILTGALPPDSPLSVLEFEAIHKAATALRKQAVRDVIDQINKGKIRVYMPVVPPVET